MGCYWIKEQDGTVVHIPGCWGGALQGPDACTCAIPLSDRETRWQEKYRATEKRLRHTRAHLDWAKGQLTHAGLRQFPLVGEIK